MKEKTSEGTMPKLRAALERTADPEIRKAIKLALERIAEQTDTIAEQQEAIKTLREVKNGYMEGMMAWRLRAESGAPVEITPGLPYVGKSVHETRLENEPNLSDEAS